MIQSFVPISLLPADDRFRARFKKSQPGAKTTRPVVCYAICEVTTTDNDGNEFERSRAVFPMVVRRATIKVANDCPGYEGLVPTETATTEEQFYDDRN